METYEKLRDEMLNDSSVNDYELKSLLKQFDNMTPLEAVIRSETIYRLMNIRWMFNPRKK